MGWLCRTFSIAQVILFLTIKASIAGLWSVLPATSPLTPFCLIGIEQAIAVYTFCVLVLRWNIPRYISKFAVLMIWIFIALVIGIPHIVHKNQRIYGNVGYCKLCISGFSQFLTRLMSSLQGVG